MCTDTDRRVLQNHGGEWCLGNRGVDGQVFGGFGQGSDLLKLGQILDPPKNH